MFGKTKKLKNKISELKLQLELAQKELDKFKTSQPPLPTYEIYGEQNKIIIEENGIERELGAQEKIPGLNLIINGNNNYVKIKLPLEAINSAIEIGNDNVHVEIGPSRHFVDVFIRCSFSDGQKCVIGPHTTISGANIILDECSSCFIGEDCKLSNSIRIWGSDGHAIMDKDTKEFLNKPTHPVIIGNKCWIGEAVRIQKGAIIPDNTIVGAGSIVTKKFTEENTIIAGSPAKIIKQNVIWSRHSIYSLTVQNPSVYEEIKRDS